LTGVCRSSSYLTELVVELPKLAVVAVDPSGIDVMLLAEPVEPDDVERVTAPLKDEAPKIDVEGVIANELVVVGCPNPLSPEILTIRKDLSSLPPT